MSTIENFDSDARDAAADALASHFQESTPDPVVETNQPPAVEQGETQAPDQSTETQVPASREIDLSNLPEEARQFIAAREREMTADYTRKTQEAAQQRAEAEQALQFINALNTDPDFARQVYGVLAETLEAEQPEQSYYTDDEDPYAFEPDDPYAQKLQELESWKANLEREFEEARWNAHVDRQLAEVRSAHPDWSDDDINDVIGFGFATQGDLHKAAEHLEAIKNRTVSGYVESKSSVQAPAILPTGSAQVPPEGFTGLDDKRLHQAALERIRAELG